MDHIKCTLLFSRSVSRELQREITYGTVCIFVSSVFIFVGVVASYKVEARLLLKKFRRVNGHQWDDALPGDRKAKFCSGL